MVYAGRHPYPKMFGPYDESSKREHCLTLLKLGLAKKLPRRQRARRSWDILCELEERIKQGRIQPIKSAYDPDGAIDPTRTVIKTAELIKLANERGERPKYLRHLLLPNAAEPAAAPPQSDQEREVIAYAAGLLKEHPHATFKNIFQRCQDSRFPRMSKNAFRERIWKPAREQAKLPPRAAPGPKPKVGQVPLD